MTQHMALTQQHTFAIGTMNMSVLCNLKAAAVGAVAATTLGLSAPAAEAYQIDCAILLCLSGGWPASAECSAARAEFIRRITPWPVEPPLQIWRCPMRAAYTPADGREDPIARLYAIAAREAEGGFSTRPEPAVLTYLEGEKPTVEGMMQLVQSYDTSNGTADVDISSPVYDFVRSIRVYSVELAYQRRQGRDGDCIQTQRVRLGTYGEQGDFQWHGSSVAALPASFTGLSGWNGRGGDTYGCRSVMLRSVFIDWRDYEGTYGHEQVNY